MNQLARRFYLSLTDAVGLLPHIKPRIARKDIEDAYFDCVLKNKPLVVAINDKRRLTVTTQELGQCMVSDDCEKRHVSPAGATVLVSLYKVGFFELKKGKAVEEPARLKVYADRASEIARQIEGDKAKQIETQKAQQAKRAAYQQRLANLDSIKPADFSYGLLNDVFFMHVGKGAGKLEIGGVEVHKALYPFKSNSGKTRSWEVNFSWLDADGQPQSITKESEFANNRRNDENRNWGLGRD